MKFISLNKPTVLINAIKCSSKQSSKGSRAIEAVEKAPRRGNRGSRARDRETSRGHPTTQGEQGEVEQDHQEGRLNLSLITYTEYTDLSPYYY